MITPEERGIKEARYAVNNIIISDYILCNIMPPCNIIPPQLKKIYPQYKVRCGCECCISTKSIHYSLLTWKYHHMKKLKYQSHNTQNRNSGEIASYIFETYKNSVIPHGFHIHNTVSEMVIVAIFPFTSAHHALP